MIDKAHERYEQWVTRYELGLLTGDDLRDFELHLLDCEECYQAVREFKEANEHLRYSKRVRRLMAGLATIDEHRTADKPGLERSGIRVWRWWPGTALVAIVLAFLILQPWQLEFHPSQEAQAVEDRLVILDFENLTGSGASQQLGRIAANLLVTDLSESHYVQVVPTLRAKDILADLKQDSSTQLTVDEAVRVGREARARWVMTGSILQETPHLVISSQVISVSTGDLENSQRVTGSPEETLFELIDKLTVRIKTDLALPDAALLEPDRLVADVTTSSTKAYWHFLEGQDYQSKLYSELAAQSYLRALEYDSTFAMAYYGLAQVAGRDYIDKAVEYIEGASRLEQYLIRSRKTFNDGKIEDARTQLLSALEQYPDAKEVPFSLAQCERALGNLEQAANYYTRATEIDPRFKLAYNNLAYVYSNMGDADRAIKAINRYTELAPNEANPYDSRGDILAVSGHLDEAIASYQKAVDKKPDYYPSVTNLGNLYVFNEDYEAARSAYLKKLAINDPLTRLGTGCDITNIFLQQGQFNEALGVIDSTIKAQPAGFESLLGYIRKARILTELERYEEALATLKRGFVARGLATPLDSVSGIHLQLFILTQLNQHQQVDQLLDWMHTHLSGPDSDLRYYWLSKGIVALARSDAMAAVIAFQEATRGRLLSDDFLGHYYLGLAYLQAGMIEQSRTTLQSMLNIYTGNRLSNCFESVKLHYFMGIAFEASGDSEAAQKEYSRFVALWPNPDAQEYLANDARERLERLRTTP